MSRLAGHVATTHLVVSNKVLLDRCVIVSNARRIHSSPTGYPHWDMTPELKYYYLMQMAYWFQQLIVLALRLEKPRKDYNELIAHHFVTLWMVWYVTPTSTLLISDRSLAGVI